LEQSEQINTDLMKINNNNNNNNTLLPIAKMRKTSSNENLLTPEPVES
jgi:hypothetical protein